MEAKGRIDVRTVATRGGLRSIHTTHTLTPRRGGGGQDTPMATSRKEGPRHITEKANSQPSSCPCCAEKHKLLGYTTKYTGMAIYSQLSRARTLHTSDTRESIRMPTGHPVSTDAPDRALMQLMPSTLQNERRQRFESKYGH